MLGGHLPETENKRIHQISGLKSGRGHLRNLGSGLLTKKFLKQYLSQKENGYLQIVITYGKWKQYLSEKENSYLQIVVTYERWLVNWVLLFW